MPDDMSEETLSNEDRLAIFSKLAEHTQQSAPPPASVSITEDIDEHTSFDKLLEMSLAKRDKIDESDNVAKDEVRDKIIQVSRLDLISKFKF